MAHDDDSSASEHANRLAERRAADAEELAKFGFRRKPVSGIVRAFPYEFANSSNDLIGESITLNRVLFGHASHLRMC